MGKDMIINQKKALILIIRWSQISEPKDYQQQKAIYNDKKINSWRGHTILTFVCKIEL